jgi:SpoVK/Ycf46/Vps4 family AAA+-type ATPase
MPPSKFPPALALKKTAKTRTASKSVRPPNHSSRRIWVVSKYAKQRLSTAEALASQLELTVNRIDLSKIPSTYIGETEKNLDRVFEAAEQKDSLLFIDEADALFGRRTSVADAHDRFANKEVGYFLQRLERFPGPAIIATRRKYVIEPALLRRFRFSVVTSLALPKVRAKRSPSRALAI